MNKQRLHSFRLSASFVKVKREHTLYEPSKYQFLIPLHLNAQTTKSYKTICNNNQ